jgi:hypothetical protein
MSIQRLETFGLEDLKIMGKLHRRRSRLWKQSRRPERLWCMV